MANSRSEFDRAILGWIGLIAALMCALLWSLLGPGASELAAKRISVARQTAQLEDWERRQQQLELISARENSGLDDHYLLLSQLGPESRDETAVTAWVLALLKSPTLRDVRISMRRTREDTESAPLRMARSANHSNAWKLSPIPVRVSFDANYSDLRDILARIERDVSPILIERLDLRRSVPLVRVELDFQVWTREEVAS